MATRRHLGFGSTPNFNNLYKQVQSLATNSEDRFAYAGWHPDSGEPPTEEQKVLLSEFTCNTDGLPTLTFRGSEKLHGENMAVAFSCSEMWVQGRNQVRTILGDQNGMAAFVEARKESFQFIIDKVTDRHFINTTTHTVVLDGEWAGGNIQRGNAACSGTDKAFYLFDYFRAVNNETGIETLYPTTEIGLPDKGIYNLQAFESYTITLDFSNPTKCEEDLKALALSIENNSPIANHFGLTDNVGEGAYLWCEYKDTMLRLKTKGEKHGGKPKAPRTPKVMVSPEEVLVMETLADKVTPPWRLTQAITESNATEMKHLGQVIKWVIADVAKEEAPTLAEAGVELKNLSRYISTIVKEYYFDHTKGY